MGNYVDIGLNGKRVRCLRTEGNPNVQVCKVKSVTGRVLGVVALRGPAPGEYAAKEYIPQVESLVVVVQAEKGYTSTGGPAFPDFGKGPGADPHRREVKPDTVHLFTLGVDGVTVNPKEPAFGPGKEEPLGD